MMDAGMRRRRRALLLAAVALVLGSCGSGGADDTAEPSLPSSDESVTTTTTDGAPTDTAPSNTSPTADETWSDIFAEIVLDPTEPGPRPILSWAEVDGAVLYQLTVLDSDGVPYWSWSGTETAVPLGGMDNPDAIGAWVFEELTWMVVARAGDGAPLAMSQRGVLEPAVSD